MTNKTSAHQKSTGLSCLLCKGKLVAIAEELLGATSRADVLYPFTLYRCSVCEHLQKDIGAQYQKIMRDVYEKNYELPGRKINIVDGKIVNRENSLVQNLVKLLKLRNTGWVLDIGTGAGYLLAAFAAELPGWEIVGHDLNNVKEAGIRAGGATEFYTGDLDTIPGKYDLITLNHVLEHLTDPVTVLWKAAALLKPDGHLVVIVPCFHTVYTDFFFWEHCSHFTPRSLSIAASLAGFDVVNKMEGLLGSVEIGFIAKRSQNEYPALEAEAVRWAQSLPGFIRGQAKGKRINVFGVYGVGMWLGAMLKGEISFFVDDDPSKQGSRFAGCLIVGVDEIPEGDTVFVAYNNPEASLKMCEKLKFRRPGVNFIAPPA